MKLKGLDSFDGPRKWDRIGHLVLICPPSCLIVWESSCGEIHPHIASRRRLSDTDISDHASLKVQSGAIKASLCPCHTVLAHPSILKLKIGSESENETA